MGVGQAPQYVSGDPLFVLDEGLRIVAWNAAVEQLTGVAAAEAVGKPCWSVLAGVAEDASVVCHAGRALAREALKRRACSSRSLLVRTSSERRRVVVSTVVAGAGRDPQFLHLLRPQPTGLSAPSAREVEELTQRQREVLELLGDGKDAREIAATLGVTVATVRTHIRHILRALGVHTQLAAVVRACPRTGADPARAGPQYRRVRREG
jgi:DNA-binding CsgD family transcriptional regulator